MKMLRFWIIVTGVWLTLFFNIERIIFYRIDANLIRSETYIFVAAIALIPLLLPRINILAFGLLLAGVTGLFLVIWYWNPNWSISVSRHYTQLNATVLLTIIQINAIILTGLFARQISYQLNQFEETIANITFSQVGKRPEPFDEEQSEMYREVRRAARYGRPLAMIALKVDSETLQVPLPQMVRAVQQAMMAEFTMAGIARILDENLFGFDTIALRDNYFIVTMPETRAQDLSHIVQRLENVINEKMNIQVHIGTASFPDQAMTFESLVALAMDQADQQLAQETSLSHNQQTVAQEINL